MREYRRILAVVDLDNGHVGVAQRALNLARLGHSELAFLHLIEPDPTLDGGYPFPSQEAVRKAYEQAGLGRLKFFAANLGAEEAELLARYGHPAHAFADCVATWQPDLVVAGENRAYLGGRHDLLTVGRSGQGDGGGKIRRLLSFVGHLGFLGISW
jgi:nucleotide-binding universal stress UspA family protein